jgi:NADH:ubiquinone oxidoreductase subunit E
LFQLGGNQILFLRILQVKIENEVTRLRRLERISLLERAQKQFGYIQTEKLT